MAPSLFSRTTVICTARKRHHACLASSSVGLPFGSCGSFFTLLLLSGCLLPDELFSDKACNTGSALPATVGWD